MKKLTQEQSAFLNQLPVKYGDALTKYAYRFLGYQPHLMPTAQDAVQETFVKAIHDVEELMAHPNKLGWLKTVLKYVLLNQRRETNRSKENLFGEEAEIPAIGKHTMLAALERWESHTTLPEVIERAEEILTSDEMETFVDHFLIGLTTEEAAAREGVSADTVRGRISRIRKKMKKYFGMLCALMLLMLYN